MTSQTGNGDSHMKHILTVDDSNSVRLMVKTLLQQAGFVVHEAADGLAGLELARDREVDLALVDLHMPGLDGLALVKALRELPQYRSTPILMMSTEASDEAKQAGRLAGANGWVSKPFDPARLVEVVRRLAA